MALTREQIVDAALNLASDYGLGDLSMRRVAAELGVQAGALYWHVSNKQQLLVAIAQRILDPAQGARSWPRSPTQVLTEFRRRLLSLRNGAEIVAVAYATPPHQLPPGELLAEQLRALGHAEATLYSHNLVRWVLGSVLAQQTALDLADAAEHPGDDVEAMTHRFDQEFRSGLAGMLGCT